jgi:heme oxygenase
MLCRQLGEQYSYSFFNSYGLETASMWMAFKSFLDRPYTGEEQDEMIQSAQDTFLTFKNWINQHELEPQL